MKLNKKKKIKGKMPSSIWLRSNGFGGLRQAIQKYPELFSHIIQEKLLKTSEEWVKVAEKLEKKYGELPSQGWLGKNNYIGLAQATRKYPEKFSHIKQEWLGGREKEYYIKETEKLAEKYGGTLPNQKWLEKNGFMNLSRAIKNHFNLFSHIPQQKLLKTINEHIKFAKLLAKNNKGLLPSYAELKKMGKKGTSLIGAMNRSPESFKHINQISQKGKSVAENVSLAEKIANQQKDKKLPHSQYLIRIGRSDIVNCKRNHPEHFSHIKCNDHYSSMHNPEKRKKYYMDLLQTIINKKNRNLSLKELRKMGHHGLEAYIRKNIDLFSQWIIVLPLRKTLKEHLKNFDMLIKKNNGILYSNKKLIKKGYAGLVQCRNKNKNLFPEVEQEKENGGMTRRSGCDDKYFKQAREIEKKYGCIPYHKWLKNNRYLMLSKCIRRYPEKFKGIKQEYYCGKTKKVRIIGE